MLITLLLAVHVLLTSQEMTNWRATSRNAFATSGRTSALSAMNSFPTVCMGTLVLADMNHNCDGHIRCYLIPAPIHGVYYAKRDIACLIIQKGILFAKR